MDDFIISNVINKINWKKSLYKYFIIDISISIDINDCYKSIDYFSLLLITRNKTSILPSCISYEIKISYNYGFFFLALLIFNTIVLPPFQVEYIIFEYSD